MLAVQDRAPTVGNQLQQSVRHECGGYRHDKGQCPHQHQTARHSEYA
jgi:hypothetical protein